MDWEALPIEIVQQIFLYLTGDDLARFGSASKLCRSLANDNYVWKKICHRDEIKETRKCEISFRVIGLEKPCEWWITYMESRMYFNFNWKFGRRRTKTYELDWEEYLACADESGVAVASADGTVSVYNSCMSLVWQTEVDGRLETLFKCGDTVGASGPEGFVLAERDGARAEMDMWGEAHVLPTSGRVYVHDEDTGDVVGWSLTSLEPVAWLEADSHGCERLLSDGRALYGVCEGGVACLFPEGPVLEAEPSAVLKVCGGRGLVAVLARAEGRCLITVWARSGGPPLALIPTNRPHCLGISTSFDSIIFTSRDLDTERVSIWQRREGLASRDLGVESVANVQLYFLGGGMAVLFIRPDWQPYCRMTVLEPPDEVHYSAAIMADHILYADRRKVVLRHLHQLHIIYFDHRD